MTEEMISAEVQRRRTVYPKMFSHPELKEDEVWVGDQPADIVFLSVIGYRKNGVPSARCGIGFLKEFEGNQSTFHPVFMNLRELIIANEKCKKEAVTAPARL